MGPVDHSAADRKDSGVRLALECVHDSAGVSDFVGRWGEGGIDRADLSRMDGELAGKALAGGCLSFGEEPVFVPDVDAALTLLRAHVRPGDVVLVKASRAAGLERVAQGLLEAGAPA